jgi:tetratricopeptide (TPR) repeat protein
MSTKNIFDIPGNKKNLERVKTIASKEVLVPFIGSGFSTPVCPTWGVFLEKFFQGLKDEFLLPEDEEHYERLKNSSRDNRFEALVDFLVEKAGRRKLEEEMKANFDKPILPEMKKKFELLHRAFPGLKITTNFDCLIEDNAPGYQVNVYYGYQTEELWRLLSYIRKNALIKIHGGIGDISSIVLSTSQYKQMYGDPSGFDPEAPLPGFLKRVLTNSPVLFIGCSMVRDRVIMIMESLPDMRPHFALMMRPDKQKKIVELNRRLSKAGIIPVWLSDFGQIEEILEMLAESTVVQPVHPMVKHGVPFVGREKELNQIRENLEKDRRTRGGSVQMITGRLFNIDGAGGVGKTTLAIEAARQFSSYFKDGVLGPIRVHEHTPMSFAMDLAGRLNLNVNEPPDAETAQRLVTAILKDHHVLLILDNAVDWNDFKYMLPFETRSSIIVTTRSREMYDRIRLQFPGLAVHETSLEKFTPGEALALFKKMLGKDYIAEEEDMYLEIARSLGHLPIALRQAVSLMVFGPRYTASRLLDKLENEDHPEILRKGRTATETDESTIEVAFYLSSPLLTPELIETLAYLAVCSPGPVPLDFLQRLTGSDEIDERLEQLFAYSWCERREVDGGRAYELYQLVRELVKLRYGKGFKEKFIRLVHDTFTDKAVHFSIKERYYLQLEEALVLAKEIKDTRLIVWLYDLFDFCTYRGYRDFYLRLTQSVEELFPGDQWALGAAYGHRALILRNFGKLEEAMALHKKEEKICEELGDRAGLARSCGNQALILKAWGKLEEAMALHKKEEMICEELGDRAGLAACCGNQALILSDWGQLEEAMALHKKEETILEELGDRAGLARTYDNQALILNAWGKLAEALALFKKEERIKKELGDRAGLARAYSNQALIFDEWGRSEEAEALHMKEEKIFRELNYSVVSGRTIQFP